MKHLLLLTLSLFFSCGKAPESPLFKESVSVYNQFSTGSTKHFASETNLPNILSKEHYQIKARLLQDRSHLELFSHSKASYFGGGIHVKIERQGNDVIVQIGIKDYPNEVLIKEKNYFQKQSEIDWTLEVKNGTLYGFRVQIWENFLNRSDFIKKQTDILTPENKIADSLQQGLTFYTKGQGLWWGIKTYKTNLISAYRVPVNEL